MNTQPKCPDGCIGWAEEQLNERLSLGYRVGRASGGEDLADIFKQQAGEEFARGNDKVASERRWVANFIAGWVENEREVQARLQREYDATYKD